MLIKNGLIVSPGNQLERPADLRIRNGIIETIAAANSLTAEPDEQVLDASSLVIAPGLIDIHVHFRDPGLTYKEDLHTGAMAAAAGGYTTVICMANTKPVVDTPETLTDILTRAKEEKIHILQCASISRGMKGQELTDFHALRDSGACGFTDDGDVYKRQLRNYAEAEGLLYLCVSSGYRSVPEPSVKCDKCYFPLFPAVRYILALGIQNQSGTPETGAGKR